MTPSTFRLLPLVLPFLAPGLVLPLRGEGVYRARRLSPTLHELSADAGGYPVKVIASIGPEGTLLVDSGEREWVPDLLATLRSLGGGAPRIIISTHSHMEHINGNHLLGAGALVIGHENLRRRMGSNLYLWQEFPASALPGLTFRDQLTLHFNGEEIRLKAYTGAHDDSDTAVWFTASKVVCVGALCNGRHFPSVDGMTGDVTRYPEVTGRLLADLPEDVTLVPGHGGDCGMAEGRAFHDMLVRTLATVRQGLDQGKDVKALVSGKVLAAWKTWEIAYMDTPGWIQTLAQGIQAKGARPRKPLFEVLYHAYKAKGVPGLVQRFQELRKAGDTAHRWTDADRQLYLIGATLQDQGRVGASEAVLAFCAESYPEGALAVRILTGLGDSAAARGEKALAAKRYRTALERTPGDTKLQEKLRKVQGE